MTPTTLRSPLAMVVHPQEVDGILEEGVEVVNASGSKGSSADASARSANALARPTLQVICLSRRGRYNQDVAQMKGPTEPLRQAAQTDASDLDAIERREWLESLD